MVSRSQYGQHQFESWGWPQFSGIDTGTINTTGGTISESRRCRVAAVPGAQTRTLEQHRLLQRSGSQERLFAPVARGAPARDHARHDGGGGVRRQLQRPDGVCREGVVAGRAGRSTERAPLTAAERNQLRPWPHIDGTFTYSDDIGMSEYQRVAADGCRADSPATSPATCPTPGRSPRTRAAAGSTSRTGSAAAPVACRTTGISTRIAVGLGYDIPHLLTWSTVWELPFGRGKRWLNEGMSS